MELLLTIAPLLYREDNQRLQSELAQAREEKAAVQSSLAQLEQEQTDSR